jgi:RNA polymerase sigma factor (sigma-70 family)
LLNYPPEFLTIFIPLAFIQNISTPGKTDAELVQEYRQSGDLKILGELYQPYMDTVFGVCMKYLKNPDAAQDAVMQIFEELISKLKKHEVDNFRPWLHQLAKNHCLMQLRTPKNLKTVELPESLMQNEDNLHLNGILEKEANFVQLEKCMEQLSGEQKQMIRLFYLEEKSYHEITRMTGQEWNQVRSLIQNGRRNLKLCIEKNSLPNE